ncbi:VOC family protein [Desulfoluna butyratoxydans]|uniref:Aldoketomutase n=1 Tax=Desulfoluna butyratoxydans TaxID=231438 RepID=A0A4V6ILD4_9BACT|nr:VOC family protein [Desulfoluna butyratoxydans]VFQ44188.1 glyoxalase/bleomycin resistance protein/dihydroxybiphenyl dioxygenase [Desulfoluna butyratoxydans]
MGTLKIAHTNFTVFDLEKSLAFYTEALDFEIVRRHEAEDGSFVLVYLGDGTGGHQLELTWLKERTEPYNLGDNEIHLAVTTDAYDTWHARHKEMGLNLWENEAMGIYFVEDPDGYWIEVVPEKMMK